MNRYKMYTSWSRGSLRMRKLPLFQVAASRAVNGTKAVSMSGGVLRTCLDILNLQSREDCAKTENPYAEEIRQRLDRAGL